MKKTEDDEMGKSPKLIFRIILNQTYDLHFHTFTVVLLIPFLNKNTFNYK